MFLTVAARRFYRIIFIEGNIILDLWETKDKGKINWTDNSQFDQLDTYPYCFN